MSVQAKSISATSVRTEIQPGIWLDSRLALWIPAHRLLVIADLHWGYVASHRARGNLLPWWGDAEIAVRLQALADDYQPGEMLWLGDVVHAAEGSADAVAFLRTATFPVTLLAGNHDRHWSGAVRRTATRGTFFLHHGDTAIAVPAGCTEIIGHHHPAVSWGDAAGSRMKLPALVAGARRLVLPAFSPWASGTPWNHQLEPADTLWAVAPSRIFAVSRPAPRPAAAAV
jgi:uncharacterized protein